HTATVQALAYSPDGTRLGSASEDLTVRIWNPNGPPDGQLEHTLRGHTRHVRCVTFSPDGRRVVSTSMDRAVKIWDATTGHEIFTLPGELIGAAKLAFSPNGEQLACTDGADVRIFDVSPLTPAQQVQREVRSLVRFWFAREFSRVKVRERVAVDPTISEPV